MREPTECCSTLLPLHACVLSHQLHISLLTHHRINQIAIPIDGAIQVAPCPFNGDGGFIHVPRSACLPSSPHTQLIRKKWGKVRFPVSNGLMRERKAALQNHFRQIAQTQCVPQPPQHDEQDTIGGIFQGVERGSCTFVEGSFAR